MVLKDIGVSKLHGTFSKMGTLWSSQDRVQGEAYENQFNLLSDTDPLLKDVLDLEIQEKVMQALGKFLIDSLYAQILDLPLDGKFTYAIDVMGGAYFIRGEEDIITGQSGFSIVGDLRKEA
jgi:hypothetical protein